uniref:hypothetical protein n=1 Tax=Amycolatopsis pittospori TaxID=2749434 RepID=UPI0015F09F3F
MTSSLNRARAVADAVLYEGYLLYPYRASAAKNQVRWQWGVLMPESYAGDEIGEHACAQAELIAEPPAQGVLHLRLRFLQLQKRVVETSDEPVPSLTVDDVEYTTWDEAVEREFETVLPFSVLLRGTAVPFQVDGGEDVEPIVGRDDARLVRRRAGLRGELRIQGHALPGPFGGVKLRVRVHNRSHWDVGGAGRNEALAHAMIAAHVLLSIPDGAFLSLTDPPEWASLVTKECVNERLWPVLVGRDTVLCSPIILSDHPEIAEQSQGPLYDGLEIDEILTLRTMTLTDEEKRQARATDARAAEIIDRVDGMPPELLDRLHGTIRYLRTITGEEPVDVSVVTEPPWWDPEADASMSPETDTVTVAGVAIGKGSRVRLRPVKRADAHDMFLAG